MNFGQQSASQQPQTNNYGGIFGGIQNAQVSRQGVYLREGNHILRVKRCKLQQSQKDSSKWFFVAEMQVVDTDCPAHSVGEEVTWLQDMNKPNRSGALGNIKGFAVAFDPEPGANVTEAEMTAIVEENGPLEGLCVRAQGILIPTKANGQFTKFNWSFCDSGKTLADFGIQGGKATATTAQPPSTHLGKPDAILPAAATTAPAPVAPPTF